MRIYFAAPWYNVEQAVLHDRVLTVLKSSRHKVYNARDNLIMTSRRHFAENLTAISNADFLVVVVAGRDNFTIWRAGYAYRAGKPVVYYSETEYDPVFEQSGVAVIQSLEKLDDLLQNTATQIDLDKLPERFGMGVG